MIPLGVLVTCVAIVLLIAGILICLGFTSTVGIGS